MRRAASADFPFLLSYHSTWDIDGCQCRLVKYNFKGENATEIFDFKIDIFFFPQKKKRQNVFL